MILKAYAKINLYLDIIGILPNGFHEIETIMQLISLHDEIKLKIDEAGMGVEILVDKIDIPADERNIAYMAAEAFLSAANKRAKVVINIKKNIPSGAGLGGGSADGAAILKGLNVYYNNIFGSEKLCEIGSAIGADIPFCIIGGRALCKGKGEIITPLSKGEKQYYIIIKPEFSCSTAEAYKLYDKNPMLIKGNSIGYYNVFEELYNDSRIYDIKSELISAGADNAMMTGSGSAVFGIFYDKKKAEAAFDKLEYKEKYLAEGIYDSDQKSFG
ncbi:MAG: 4-(cytidine 5'-diphospho)-2-C-methyl-D-erythritol kinase [Eubacterium sp.]|jgi:4-diphosphocytidyl-2-C-methyl-D-erythritol kinase|nr:4-(cytidine 5'-diphospho)-2-C-methyl-D-erythritol kinase [Eubacterium sp.]